jgi:Uma2 family endonuclease
MPTAQKLLTYDEWLALPVNDETREECVNGIVEKMPPPKFDHAWVVKRLTRQLERQLDDSIFVADSNFGLVIRKVPLTQRTPDIAVFRLDRMVLRNGYVHSAPELAVEVLSPGNTRSRVEAILADYASIGVPEVWIVDPKNRAVSVRILESGVYTERVLPHNGVTAPARFPSVTVDFAAIWP